MERKVKYDYAFKLECVELVLKKHHSDRYVSKLKQIPRWNIRKWVSFYKAYGEIGLLPRINQSYSAEFKLKVHRSAIPKAFGTRLRTFFKSSFKAVNLIKVSRLFP
jgi:transposase